MSLSSYKKNLSIIISVNENQYILSPAASLSLLTLTIVVEVAFIDSLAHFDSRAEEQAANKASTQFQLIKLRVCKQFYTYRCTSSILGTYCFTWNNKGEKWPGGVEVQGEVVGASPTEYQSKPAWNQWFSLNQTKQCWCRNDQIWTVLWCWSNDSLATKLNVLSTDAEKHLVCLFESLRDTRRKLVFANLRTCSCCVQSWIVQ